MVSYRLVTAALVASVHALPLNINLGAYSPALVVGDGEISFGGGQDVSQLFNTLEGAAVNAATGQSGGGARAGATQGAAAGQPAAAGQTAANGAARPATVAAGETPVAAAASTQATDSALNEQAASISTLQGMGKEIAPREGEDSESPKAKRDLQGFDRALKYAEAALVKGPVVQLGTGEKGAGVGIVVDNRPASGAANVAGAATPAAAAPAAPAAGVGKRDEEASASQPKRRTKITTMYVRRGLPAEMQTSEFETRDTSSVPIVAVAPAKEKRDEPVEEKRETTSIDAINLNVDDPQGITMTFVETEEEA